MVQGESTGMAVNICVIDPSNEIFALNILQTESVL